MKPFQKKRLLKLANFLSRQVPEKHFYMGNWGMYGVLSLNSHKCGTSGCALGWATVLFKRQGYNMGSRGPEYRGASGLDSAVSFFGISGFSAHHLFSASDNNRWLSTKQVAKNIRQEVKTYA